MRLIWKPTLVLGFLATLFVLSSGAAWAQDGAVPEARPTEAQRDSIDGIVSGTLVVSFALVLSVAGYVSTTTPKVAMTDKLGSPDWSFSESWASTLTVVGALLGTILASGVIPEQTTGIPATSLAGLDLFFGALVVIAPVIYSAGSAGSTPKQGDVWIFLIATTATLWGCLGQVVTAFSLFGEMERAGFVSGLTLGCFRITLAAGLLAMLVYAVRSIASILRSAPGNNQLLAQDQALPRWSLL